MNSEELTELTADALGQIVFRLETNIGCVVGRATALPLDLIEDIDRDIERLKVFKKTLEEKENT